MNSFPGPSKFKYLLAICVSIVPACLLLALILKYRVDVPYWDEWQYVSFFVKFSRGTLTLGDLFVQQNEYRQFFPNLIFVGLGWLTKWDKTYELLVGFALACLVSFNIYRLESMNIGVSRARRMTLFFLSNLLIFPPLQYENWLLGMQIIYFMPIACITTCLVIAYSQFRPPLKFLLCMGLATVSTFSSANGLLCWVVILPLLSRPGEPENIVTKRWSLVWVAGFLVCTFLYFYGYHSTPGHPSPINSLIHPLRAGAYFFILVGKAVEPSGIISLWGHSHWAKEIIAGSTGLILTGLFVALTWVIRRDLKLKSHAAVWVVLGSYSIGTAILVTVGRSFFGLEQAFSQRYTTFTLYLSVALLHLIPTVLDRKLEKAQLMERTKKLLPVLAGCLAVWLSVNYAYNVRQMSGFNKRLLQGKACLLLINVVQDDCLTDKVFPNIQYLKVAANDLDRLGFLRPSLIKSSRVQDIAMADAQNAESYGALDSVSQTNGDLYTASGWAVWRPREKPADAILLTYDKGEGDSVIFALTTTGEERYVIDRLLRSSPPTAYASWHKSFSLKELPANPLIKAWAFDARTSKAVQLDGWQIIQNTTTPAMDKHEGDSAGISRGQPHVVQ